MTTAPVRLFARARDLAGTDIVMVEMSAGTTVGEVRRVLAEQVPALAGLIPRCAVAVNGDFADDALEVPRDAELALLPPVSGG